MTDLHTHILPGMDDGAKTPEESLQMLRMERDQGVDTVVLTPHFYRDRERPEQFLARRRASAEALRDALMALPEEEIRTMPRLILGAEVAWVPNLPDMPELSRMCMGRSKYLLLELPFSAWSDPLFRQLRELMDRTGVTPVIAHVERYACLFHGKALQRIRSRSVSWNCWTWTCWSRSVPRPCSTRCGGARCWDSCGSATRSSWPRTATTRSAVRPTWARLRRS